MRAVHVPADPTGEGGAGTFLLFDDECRPAPLRNRRTCRRCSTCLPIGLALVDRDGRFLTMNEAFRQAAGVKGTTMPVYPGDLVVKEDKAAVADAVRRNARGPAMSGDLAVRLARQPAEPVALTIAGLRGLGDAAVLLLLKDNSEEAKLKRQVAQATKMQVVGQLAGGVAHDFNNILTAIIGHCDLMLMRHTPGDSDYDDIQQIKSNSNRAAGLTRQLLAFSRQQTLRPQVLQLPDVVSEVSHLLKRLLGETVELVVKHGRSLGPIRADPGQLEQVIVNLAVNARDAMAGQGRRDAHHPDLFGQGRPGRRARLGHPADRRLQRAVGHRHRHRHCAERARQDVRAVLHHQGGREGDRASACRRSMASSSNRAASSSPIRRSVKARASSSICPSIARRPRASRSRKTEKAKKDELWGSGTVLLVEDEPMVRSVAERALTRHGYTRDHRRQWRGGARVSSARASISTS